MVAIEILYIHGKILAFLHKEGYFNVVFVLYDK